MKDSNSNTLYLLQNPYQSLFSLNSDDLNGLINDEIYCMVNIDGTTTTTTKIGDTIGAHFLSLIKICQRTLPQNESTQSINNDLLEQNEKVIQQNDKVIEQHEKLIFQLRETQQDIRELFGLLQTNQKALMKLIEPKTTS